jgi:transcriptional regulator with XRE-family HTH domain
VVDGISLRRAREAAGLSLRELAQRGGLSVPYLSDVELNRRRATPRVIAVYDAIPA